MDGIKINTNEVLILKSDALHPHRAMEELREYIKQQIKEGVVIIPNGFSYEIWKRDYCIVQEGEQWND